MSMSSASPKVSPPKASPKSSPLPSPKASPKVSPTSASASSAVGSAHFFPSATQTVSVPNVSPTRRPSGSPLPPSAFSVASCNVLRHATYVKYAAQSKVGALDPSVRQLSTFRLTSYAADIVCMQEWSPSADHEPHHFPNRLIEFRDTYTVIDEHLNGKAGVAIAFDHSKFALTVSQYLDWGSMKGCLAAVFQERRGAPDVEHPLVGVVSVHASWGSGKAASELAKVLHLITTVYNFSRVAQWVIMGDFNTSNKEQLLQTLGVEWTDANQDNLPTHRSGDDRHEQYDFMFYKFGELVMHDFSVQPSSFEQLISHSVDQRDQQPPPFFSDHAILRSTFLRAKDA